MRLLLALFLATCCHASESRNMPDMAKDAVHRAQWEFTKYGAKLPRTRFIWADKGQCPRGYYAVAYKHRGYWTVFLNATDFTWPRWEVSLDKIVEHEISRTLEWGDCPADSVAERVLYDHLSVSDVSRIGK